MTLHEACRSLNRRPLKFGDPLQIKAVDFIGMVEEAYISFAAPCPHERDFTCDECNGEGMVDCKCSDCNDIHEKQCPSCKGKGVTRNDVCETCFPDLDVQILAAIKTIENYGWPEPLKKPAVPWWQEASRVHAA